MFPFSNFFHKCRLHFDEVPEKIQEAYNICPLVSSINISIQSYKKNNCNQIEENTMLFTIEHNTELYRI
jgi:hypothetical protein